MINSIYKTDIFFRDNSFTPSKAGQCSASLGLSADRLDFAVTERESATALVYESFVLNKENRTESVRELFEKHDFMAADWASVTMTVWNPYFVFVPEALFAENAEAEYLRLNADFPETGYRTAQHLNANFGLRTVFAADEGPAEFFTEIYSGKIRFMHGVSSFLHGLSGFPVHLNRSFLHLFVRNNKLTVALFDNQKLHFANIYDISAPSDILYYAALTADQFGLDRMQTTVMRYGEPDTGESEQLDAHFLAVREGDRPAALVFAPELEALPRSFAFDIFSSCL